jgi:hypothetical protein
MRKRHEKTNKKMVNKKAVGLDNLAKISYKDMAFTAKSQETILY